MNRKMIVMKKRYSIFTRKNMVTVRCLDCGNIKTLSEEDMETYIKCDKCSDSNENWSGVGGVEREDKLRRVWRNIKGDMLEGEWKKYSEFKEWVREIGYRGWEEICKIDVERPYSKGNIKVDATKSNERGGTLGDRIGKLMSECESIIRKEKEIVHSIEDIEVSLSVNDALEMHKCLGKVERCIEEMERVKARIEKTKIID